MTASASHPSLLYTTLRGCLLFGVWLLGLGGVCSGEASPEPSDRYRLSKRCRQALSEERGRFELKEGRWRYSAGPQRWEGALLLRVELSCDLARCARGRLEDTLKRSLRLPLWQPLTPARLEQAYAHLQQTGLFRSDSYVLFEELTQTPPSAVEEGAVDEDAQKHIAMYVCARAHTTVRSLKFTYTDAVSTLYPKQFISELQKRLDIKRGGVFPLDPGFLREQEEQVRTLYERLGYAGTKVRIKTRFMSHQREVDVTVVVEEGRRPQVAPPLVRQPETGHVPYAEVVQAITPDTFFDVWPGFFGVFGVGRYDLKQTRERASKLELMLRDEGYFAARVRAIGEARDGGKVRPVIHVDRGPRVELKFEGNESLSDKELTEELTFAESGAVDEVELEQSRLKIEQRYRSIAHYYAEVSARMSREGDVITVTFSCDEGPQVYVGEVELQGVSLLDQEELKSLMVTQGVAPRGVLATMNASAGVLQDALLNQDLERILKRYRAEGFSQALYRCADPKRESRTQWRERLRAQRAQGDRRVGAFDVWTSAVNQHVCFQVIPDTEERAHRRFLKVVIMLAEGERTTVDRVDLGAYLQAMDESMRADALDLLRGMGFYNELNEPISDVGLSLTKLSLLDGVVLRYLRQSGHLKAEVSAQCQLKTPQGELMTAEPCDLDVFYGRRVSRLSYQVKLGPRAEVDGLIVRGQLRTKQSVIERELLLQPGTPLSAEALLLSQTNLRSLGLFRSVSIESIGLGEATEGTRIEPLTMVVSVEESPPWQADALLGVLLRESPLTGSLQNNLSDLQLLYSSTLTLRHKNVLGRGWEIGGGLSHDNLLNTPLDVQGDSATWGVGPFFNNPRLFGSHIQLNTSLSFEQSISAQRDAYVQRGAGKAIASYDFYHTSYPSRWGKGLRLDLTLEGKVERRRALTVDGERRSFGGTTETLSLTPRLLYDQRDNPLHPTRGFYASLGLDGLLSLDDGSITGDLSASFRETLTAQYVRSFFKQRLIIAPTVRFGAVQSSLSDDALPADFSFKAGGDGVPFPVRGYSDASIEACQGVEGEAGSCVSLYEVTDLNRSSPARVGGRSIVNVNLEARFPTMLIGDLWGAVFNDWGAVSTSLSGLRDAQLFPSLGFGLRYLVTGQIPVRLDVAYPLKETVFDPERQLRLHINIFYTL